MTKKVLIKRIYSKMFSTSYVNTHMAKLFELLELFEI